MITIHLDQHRRTTIRAGLEEEIGATVTLSIDLERHELGDWRARPATLEAERATELGVTLQAVEDDDELGKARQKVHELETRFNRLHNLAAAYEEELKRACEILDRIDVVDRTLLPDEARELAAMLWHYADRAEAPK